MRAIGEELERMREEYARVHKEYEIDDARGIPMSVRERYQRELASLLAKIRELQERGNRVAQVPRSWKGREPVSPNGNGVSQGGTD